jgi:hypothetical protein
MRTGRPKQVLDPAGRKRRKARLEIIGGFFPHEIENHSIGGRIRVLEILREHDLCQRKISAETPGYYSPDFHRMILAAIADEHEAITALQRRLAPGHPALQLKLIKV